jgi:glycerophosphoryl diester phosphodiesterase/cephalosporin-C deacetylase-like acetyl esterase
MAATCGITHGQLIIAHRGASFDAPENTLAAFQLAWQQGADGVEGDFYLTKDCRIVCIHDKDTTRTSGVSLSVADSTLAELRTLDVGKWKGDRFAGETIPTLEEVLATVPDGKRLLIEIKCGNEIVPVLSNVLDDSEIADDQIAIIAFDRDVIATAKKQLPNIKAFWLTGYKQDAEAGTWHPSVDEVLTTIKNLRADGVDTHAHDEVIDADFAKRLRAAGAEFHCWTVNDPNIAVRMQRLGVDSITTDRPAFIRENLRAAELAVLPDRIGDMAKGDMMNAYLDRLAREAFQRRHEEYEKLKTVEQIEARQERLREFFFEQLGQFPERTPLNAKVTGVLECDGYRIEKVIFESRPGFSVTANFYRPDAEPPYPAVLVPCGHIQQGKAGEPFQRACIILAKHGIAAMCYDPIGQGERVQLLADNNEAIFKATTEHTLLGVGSILLGRNTASFRVWDGLRGIDYLVSRDDVDPNRIGCTGNSGGGMMTSYLMSLDPRIVCAAPSCYITSFAKLLHTIGPQDAEQNIHAIVAQGMEQADFLIMRAPKPTLICCATRDFFDIQGTWDSFREAKRIYTRLGYSERVGIVETDATHGFSPDLRVGMAQWMRRWLLNKDEPVVEEPSEILSAKQLQCTREGQVLRMKGARSAFDLNIEEEERLSKQRDCWWRETDKEKALAEVRDVVGVRRLKDLPKPDVENVGTLKRDGYCIEKLVLKPEEGILLPALAFVPKVTSRTGPAYLYLHDDGKHVDAGPGGCIEKWILAGHLVLAVDLRGTGETQQPSGPDDWFHRFGDEADNAMAAYLLDKTYVGMRAEDTLLCARFLAEYQSDGEQREVHVVGIGEVGPAVLHAVALQPELFASMTLRRSLSSWSDIIHAGVSTGQMPNAVHGALRRYDLPDLISTLPSERVILKEPVDVMGKRVRD